MLWQRIGSALIGIPLLLWVSYAGGYWLGLALVVIILLGLGEYGKMMNNMGYQLSFTLLFLCGVLMLGSFWRPEERSGFIFLIFAAHMFMLVWGKARFPEIAFSFLGVFFVAWTLGHLVLIRERVTGGFEFLLLSFIITWSTDTGAYFCGRIFGRHKLSPALSPNKTVEGALGGVAFCVLVVAALGRFLDLIPPPGLMGLAALGSLAGQWGDLAESSLKRWAGVKDSGRIIPGHGGILDRFDSLILVAPLVYYFLTILIKV